MPVVDSPASSPAPEGGFGRRRQALLRFLGFVVAAVALTVGGLFVLTRAFHLRIDVDHAPLWVLLAGQVALVLCSVVLPAAAVAVVTREPSQAFGWGHPPRRRQLAIGAVGGFALMSLLIGALAASGAVSLAPSSAPGMTVFRFGAGDAAIFALTAISEEGLFRGYALTQLGRAISFWPAAVVMSLLFAATHLGHRSETVLGLTQAALFGLLMAFSVRRTGGLWFALGFHAAWDFSETFVYGVPDSGLASDGSLLASRFHGPAWLTGGTAGPEGSVLVLLILALAALWLCFGFRASQGGDLGRTPARRLA